jgi:hypothetical protein
VKALYRIKDPKSNLLVLETGLEEFLRFSEIIYLKVINNLKKEGKKKLAQT